jgi:4'-phosphopantetheinyl transferase
MNESSETTHEAPFGAWRTTSLAPLTHGPEVNLWHIDVPSWRPRVPSLRGLLAPDESARADRFKFEIDADRLVIARGVLRLLMGTFLQLPPERVAFSYSATGKPSVEGLEFNVSHSGAVILIATHRHRIGVDVESVDQTIDVADIGRLCFTERERALLFNSISPTEEFFRLWTRKEAWLKAVGSGLSFPLLDVDVADALAPMVAPSAMVDGALPRRIIDLPVAGDYAGACAISGPDCEVRLWHLQETWGDVAC